MTVMLSPATVKPGLRTRLLAHPFIQAVLGIVLTFAAVPLTMMAASMLVEKPYRVVWPQLLAAVLVWCGYHLYVRRIEKREPAELSTRGMGRELGAGLLIGTALVAATFALLWLLGAYRFDGVNPVTILLLLPVAELLLVGLAEEMMFRGVIFGVALRSLGTKWAIVISSAIFALGHLPNEGVSILAVAALLAYGVLQAALYLTTRRLWVCIGTHIAWNYCVGQVFSSAVSGHASNAGWLNGQLMGDTLLTGGAFGVEGSLVTVLLIAGAAAWVLRSRSARA